MKNGFEKSFRFVAVIINSSRAYDNLRNETKRKVMFPQSLLAFSTLLLYSYFIIVTTLAGMADENEGHQCATILADKGLMTKK